jgi:hypothetical protein
MVEWRVTAPAWAITTVARCVEASLRTRYEERHAGSDGARKDIHARHLEVRQVVQDVREGKETGIRSVSTYCIELHVRRVSSILDDADRFLSLHGVAPMFANDACERRLALESLEVCRFPRSCERLGRLQAALRRPTALASGTGASSRLTMPFRLLFLTEMMPF